MTHFGAKSAQFPCQNANLPNCTYSRIYHGGGLAVCGIPIVVQDNGSEWRKLRSMPEFQRKCAFATDVWAEVTIRKILAPKYPPP